MYTYLKKWKWQVTKDYCEWPGRSGKDPNGSSKNGKHCWNKKWHREVKEADKSELKRELVDWKYIRITQKAISREKVIEVQFFEKCEVEYICSQTSQSRKQ